ncbi:MAG: nucleotidyltransferase domain-containing protein [Victivallales bacterium]|jgi:predicted nucleotidyltransferase
MMMINRNKIRKYAREIGRQFHPDRIILFGSYASNSAKEDSDVDILVIMDHDNPRNVDQAIAIQLKVDAPFPMDLIVKRPADISERVSMNDTFLKSVLQEGRVLYG